ncbi:ABC transporter ATP-binding protein [Sneathiella glossodoripedis]|uniref:ABC transporter ATP-binding protein n=1 Tax=Sneathiella glossodoripedis TaxID=418853 RepID=UPI000472D122|nr:ABC transporter ATP-binding protein [Sneathiella glossodoripedis]
MVANDTDAALLAAQRGKPSPRLAGANLPPVGVQINLSQIAFSGKPILEDLSLTLTAGEHTCLLGPSGVGKTSILKSLAGLIPMAEGSSIQTTDDEPVVGRIAYMGQSDLLLPWASVLDNVLIGQKLKGERPNEGKAIELLKLVGLAANLADRPDTLSGGMRQRVALARTLMEDAPILLVDEPFSALDAITRHKLQALLCDLTRDRTVLMITHDPMEALRVADQIIVLCGQPVKAVKIEKLATAAPRDLGSPDISDRYDQIMSLLELDLRDMP